MDKDLPPKILDSNSVWAESQAVRKGPNQEIGGPLRRLIHHWKKAGPRVWRRLETFS